MPRPTILRYGAEFQGPDSGRTGGTHLEFIGNRDAVADAVPGIRHGRGNRVTDHGHGDD